MDDALLMRGFKGLGNLPRDGQRFVEWKTLRVSRLAWRLESGASKPQPFEQLGEVLDPRRVP